MSTPRIKSQAILSIVRNNFARRSETMSSVVGNNFAWRSQADAAVLECAFQE